MSATLAGSSQARQGFRGQSFTWLITPKVKWGRGRVTQTYPCPNVPGPYLKFGDWGVVTNGAWFSHPLSLRYQRMSGKRGGVRADSWRICVVAAAPCLVAHFGTCTIIYPQVKSIFVLVSDSLDVFTIW